MQYTISYDVNLIMNGAVTSTFVIETLNGNYKLHLDRQDIVNIARIGYGWCNEDANRFRVISDLESEKGQVELYINMLKKQKIHSVTLVISLNHSHWVTLVITNRYNNSFNQNLLAYYADSIANTMPQLIKDILTGIEIEILSIHQEDPDGCNSGLFALENARVINESLREGKPVDLSRIPNGKDHFKLRRSEIALKIACRNLQSNVATEIRCQSSSKADDSEKSSKKNAESINLTETKKGSKKLYYPKRAGTSGISGQLYETKLAMLVLKRALKNNKITKFRLGTNIDGIGVFDDLILSCHYNDNRHHVIFLQAKHRDDPEKNKITLANFTKENGDISFDKCFDSYLKIRRKFNLSSNDEVFKSDCENIECDLVVFTSGNENFDSDSFTREIDPGEDDLLQTNSRGKIFQFNCNERNIIDQVMRSASISRMKQLAESLAKFIFSSKNNYSNMMSDELFRTYHVILARKVIKVAEQGKGDYREGTFLPEFYENNESSVSVLRDALYKESITQHVNSKLQSSELKVLIEETIKDPSNENVSKLLGSALIYDAESNKLKIHSKVKLPEIVDLKNTIQRMTDDSVKKVIAITGRKILESAKFRLHNTFGCLDFKVKGEKRLEHVRQKLVELVTESKIEDNKIVVKIDGDMVGPMKHIKDGDIAINGGIGGLVGNLLVLDDETKMLKFTNDREILPENAKKLLSMLQNNLSEDQLKKARFHITLNDFPLLSLECEESLIRDFLKKLKICTNQAKEDEVEEIFKDEMKCDYNSTAKESTLPYRIKSDVICLKAHDEIQKWWKQQNQGIYLTESCEFLNEAQKSIIDRPLLSVLHFLYLNRIRQYNIEFGSTVIDDLKLGDFLATPDVQFLTISTAEIELSAIKLLQYFEAAKICITFLNLDYIFAKHCYRETIDDLKTENKLRTDEKLSINGKLKAEKTLLIIVLESKKYLNGFREEIKNIWDICKTAILLTGNNLYEEVKGNLPKESTEKIDCKINLAHLALQSQEELLKDKEIIFQGKKVKLGQLIDSNSKDLVLGNTLSKLLRNEPVEVSKSPMIDTKPYYIERRFVRKFPDFFCSLKPVDIFAIINYNSYGALQLANLNGRILRDFEHINRRENQPENFIILLNDWEFVELCKIYPNYNIHLLEYYRGGFMLKKTHGDISNSKDALERCLIVGNLENEFCDKFISNEIENKVAVISAEPGMGKSSILTNMAKYIKDNYSSMWLVRINLNDYTQILASYDFSDGLNSAMGFLSKVIGLETDLEKGLFERSIKERGKIILFFDGFDEISPNYEAIVMKLLKTFENSKVEKIIVTARPYNFESGLEKELNALKIRLVGLEERSQVLFLIRFWEVSLGIEVFNDPHKLAVQFAIWLTETLNRLINYRSKIPFLSIPLHCMLIADYFKQNFKEFYDSGARQMFYEQKVRLSTQLNLSSLYCEIVKGKYFNIYCKDKKKKDLTNVYVSQEEENRLYPEFLQEHRLLALLTLLSKSDFDKILSRTEKRYAFGLRDEFQTGEGIAGMIDKIVDGKPQFIHRTFAEYFASCYFWEKYKSIEFRRFETFIKSDICCLSRMEQTCRFFQLEAQRDLKDQLEFLHRNEKLEFLLSERCFSLCETNDSLDIPEDMRPFLTKLVDFHYDENIIIQKHNNLEMKEKLGLLRAYCKLGLTRFVKALAEVIHKQDLIDDLKEGSWFDSPLWLATLYKYVDVVKILKEKFNYSATWTDTNGIILLECILNGNNYLNDVYNCIANETIDFSRPYCEWYHERYDTKLVDFIENGRDTIFVKFLENVDIDFLNNCKLGHVSNVLLFSSRLYQNPNLLENLINRKMDVNGGGEEKLKPIHVVAYQYSPSFLVSWLPIFVRNPKNEIFQSIEILLQNGAIYNLKDEFDETVLDYATRVYKISLLFGNIKRLLDSPLAAKIAKKAFQFVAQGIDVNCPTLSYLVLFPPLYKQVVFNLKSLQDQTGGDSAEYEYKISKIEPEFNQLVYKLEWERIDIVKAHLIFPYYLIYEYDYDRLVKLLFNKRERYFHVFENSDEAISKLKKHFESAVNQVKSFLNEIPKIDELKSPYKLFEIDKMLKILSQENATLDRRITDLISEIHDLDGTEYLCQIVHVYLSGDKTYHHNMRLLSNFDKVSETFQLLTTIDESFSAAQNNDNQVLKKLLHRTEQKFLKAVINCRNENRQTLLDIAEDLKSTDMTELLKNTN